MIEATLEALKLAARTMRRFVKVTLKRLGFEFFQEKPYKPCFSDHLLASRLEVHPPSDRDVSSSDGLTMARYNGARKARILFGPRFFVDPDSIVSLSKKLQVQQPDAFASLMSAVETDFKVGIPIYAVQGPPIGPEFPWSALPRGPGQDEMYRKRPHRFAFAPRNAFACLFEPEVAIRLRGMLDAWMSHAESGKDRLCYDSNLGVIQRILALSWCWAYLAARPEEESAEGLGLEWQILRLIEADVRFLEPLLGQSVPNNHLLADRFAAWYLRTVFPELLDKPELCKEEQWCDELLAQTYPDGGSFEHSSHYHEFACEMGSAYVLLARRNKLTPDSRVLARVKVLLEYQCVLTGPEAKPLPIGNAVEDTLFHLDPGEAWCPGSLREIYRALFDPELIPASHEDETIIRAFWFLEGRLAPPSDAGHADLQTHFMLAGLYTLPDRKLGARLIFRTGPAPDTSVSAGHMHSDLLSVYMNVRGYPMLVDAGTYTYRGYPGRWRSDEPEWRSYFAGPNAHNTLTIPNHDPLGAIVGDFRSREVPIRARHTHHFSERIVLVEATLDGTGPYAGARRACIHVHGEYWVVLDVPPSQDPSCTAMWLGFQFAPHVDLIQNGRSFGAVTEIGIPELYMAASPGFCDVQTLYGSRNPIGGWVSPRYGELCAAPQLRLMIAPDRPTSAVLFSTAEAHRDAEVISVRSDDTGRTVVHIRSGVVDDYLVVGPIHNAWESVPNERGVHLEGRFAWIRLINDQPNMLHWLDARKLVWPQHSVHIETRHGLRKNLSLGPNSYDNSRAEFLKFEWPCE